MMDVESPNGSGAGHSVLVVEDNPHNMKLVRTILRSEGYSVLQAVDGEAGLACLGTHTVSLLVLDIQLPGVSGLDVARLVRDHPTHRSLPILAVTAFAMTGDREAALQAGCSAYLSKPIDVAEFLAAIALLLGPKVGMT